MKNALKSAGIALLLVGGLGAAGAAIVPAEASNIKYIVNGTPVTTYDVQRRAAFLKLQNRKGDTAKLAAEEMVEQTLRTQEAARLGIRIADQAVDDAYARFAKNNKMPLKQLDTIMEKSGVTKSHFKDYIRAQMAWNRALGARFSAASRKTSEADAVQRMFKEKGSKPSATEYMLQQVIFVVPPSERAASLSRRRQEAESMRQRFGGCDSTRQFAKGLIDVTVRDLGRTLAPALPNEWADAIKGTRPGSATPVRETDRGVEFIGVCSAREVSDDRVSQMLVQNGDTSGKNTDDLSAQYLAEVRKRAKIVER